MEKNRIKALVIDDEKDGRHLLCHSLKRIPHMAVIEESACVEDALFKIIDLSPDMIFLDMKMPGRNGLELIELLGKRGVSCHVVAVSGDQDSIIPAIKNNVYDFLLKPVKQEDLEKVIAKFLEKRNTNINEKLIRILKKADSRQKIRLSSTNSHVLIDPNDIVYCEAQGSYTTIYLENGTKELANNYLGMIAKSLPALLFYRISRSYLINLNKLEKVNRGDYSCTLVSGKKRLKIQGSKKQVKILCEMDFE